MWSSMPKCLTQLVFTGGTGWNCGLVLGDKRWVGVSEVVFMSSEFRLLSYFID